MKIGNANADNAELTARFTWRCATHRGRAERRFQSPLKSDIWPRTRRQFRLGVVVVRGGGGRARNCHQNSHRFCRFCRFCRRCRRAWASAATRIVAVTVAYTARRRAARVGLTPIARQAQSLAKREAPMRVVAPRYRFGGSATESSVFAAKRCTLASVGAIVCPVTFLSASDSD